MKASSALIKTKVFYYFEHKFMLPTYPSLINYKFLKMIKFF